MIALRRAGWAAEIWVVRVWVVSALALDLDDAIAPARRTWMTIDT